MKLRQYIQNYIYFLFLSCLFLHLGGCDVYDPFEEEENDTDIPKEYTYIPKKYMYVDLGLSVKWATFNVGANAPEEYGDYFAWGETTTKSIYDYSWAKYKWCEGTENSFTKYCISSAHGEFDNKSTLEATDDVANVELGGAWRMPTKEEFAEAVGQL